MGFYEAVISQLCSLCVSCSLFLTYYYVVFTIFWYLINCYKPFVFFYFLMNCSLSTYLRNLMFYWPCIVVYQYSKTNVMHFLFNLLRIKGLLCFEHYLLIFRRRCANSTWHIACVLCLLAAPGAVNLHNTHPMYQALFVQCLLKISK
jgi:hypothetical protein